MDINSLQSVEQLTQVAQTIRAATNLLVLLQEEGSCVEFYGSSRNVIFVTAHWTDWVRRRVAGDNWSECLDLAMAMKIAWEESEAELTRATQK